MMDYDDVYGAVTNALSDSKKKDDEDYNQYPPGMIAIEPFDAVTDDDLPVQVVGIGTNMETAVFEFIVIKAMDDGELFPTFESSVWPKK